MLNDHVHCCTFESADVTVKLLSHCGQDAIALVLLHLCNVHALQQQ